MSRSRCRRIAATRSVSGTTRAATTALREPAQAALDRVGLGARADVRVDRLSHGEQRQLEIAMALATKPRLLLLDEPMAGMGPEESARMVAMLRELKGGITILLIEHDMETVFALADRITVLVYGRVIASGDPAAIRADAAVREAYLGEQEARRPWLNAPLLEVSDIETSYGLSRVLFGISFAIAPGEMVSLMGRNGMGKTTTVRSIMGLTRGDRGLDPLRRRGHSRSAGLSRRQARHRPGAGRPPGFSQSHHARKSRRHRRQPHRAPRAVDARQGAARCFRGSPRAPAAWRTCSPAASSRCWRSAAR